MRGRAAMAPWLALVSVCVLTGCLEVGHGGFLDAGAATGVDAAEASYDHDAPADPRALYPTEGLGTNAGDVLADLELVNADGQPFWMHDVFFDPSVTVLLVSTAASWCAVCIKEQPKLEDLHVELADRGLFVLVAYFETASFIPAQAPDAARWRSHHELTFTVAADESNAFGAYYDTTLAPMTMVVDVPTMRILRIESGFDEPAVRALLESRLRPGGAP